MQRQCENNKNICVYIYSCNNVNENTILILPFTQNAIKSCKYMQIIHKHGLIYDSTIRKNREKGVLVFALK